MSANLHREWDAYQKLDQLGDPWAALNQLVDFEAFRDILEECWHPAEAESAKGGRPPYDAVMMFKLLLVGRKCGLSDEKLEVLALDSLRVLRFLGVSMGDAIPDRATIARYRSQLDENTIRGYVTTTANVHDINVLEDLVDPTQQRQSLYADAAYRSEEVEHALRAQRIHFAGGVQADQGPAAYVVSDAGKQASRQGSSPCGTCIRHPLDGDRWQADAMHRSPARVDPDRSTEPLLCSSLWF